MAAWICAERACKHHPRHVSVPAREAVLGRPRNMKCVMQQLACVWVWAAWLGSNSQWGSWSSAPRPWVLLRACMAAAATSAHGCALARSIEPQRPLCDQLAAPDRRVQLSSSRGSQFPPVQKPVPPSPFGQPRSVTGSTTDHGITQLAGVLPATAPPPPPHICVPSALPNAVGTSFSHL